MENEEEKKCCHHEHNSDSECCCHDSKKDGECHNHDEECCGHEHTCECCEGDCGDTSNLVTLVDEETGEKINTYVLFTIEMEGKTIAFASIEGEKEEEEMTVVPLEVDDDGHITVIDIETDPRKEQLKDIFEDWVNNFDSEETVDEEDVD